MIMHGVKDTGVAVTTGGYRPRPLAILSDLDAAKLSSAVVDYVRSERAANVVLGLPLHKNGTDGEQRSITRLFGQSLLAKVRRRCGANVDVELCDEGIKDDEIVSSEALLGVRLDDALEPPRRVRDASDPRPVALARGECRARRRMERQRTKSFICARS